MDVSASPEPLDARRRLSAAQRRRRNAALAAEREAGLTWPEVAARFELSERQARRAYADHVALVAARVDLDPDALVVQVLAAHVRALSGTTALLETADSDNGRIGAANAVARVGAGLLAALERVGLIGDASLERYEGELRFAARAIFDLGQAYGIPADEVARAVASLPSSRRVRARELEAAA